MITVTDLTCGYNGDNVLNGATLAVERGEFVAILGANGSGKTTLLRALTGILPARRGSVRLNGRDLTTMQPREIAQLIAVVPQENTVAFDFRVRDIVLMGRIPHLHGFGFEGKTDIEIAEQAMAQAGIAHLADRRIGELSGGEKQRVAIARAFAQQAPILLLDEPTAHLDLSFQISILRLVREISRRQGLTALAIIHDVNLASLFAGRVILLCQGRVYADGVPKAVITPEAIRDVYGAAVTVSRHPETGAPLIHPVAGDLDFAAEVDVVEPVPGD